MFKNIVLLSLLAEASAFTSPNVVSMRQQTAISLTSNNNDEASQNNSRRSFFGASAVAAVSLLTGSSAAQAEIETRQGIDVTPFNALQFNYRNSQFGGLEADDLDEPSVSYADFCDRLKKGEVSFVEFLAPDGDVAYATFKPAKEGDAKLSPIRIGEGFPVEQHDGWSSPAFAVRTVKNAGVPYKFTVPGMEKFQS